MGEPIVRDQLFGIALIAGLCELVPVVDAKPMLYPKPDGVVSFDTFPVFPSGTRHDEDEPIHLKLKDPGLPIRVNLPVYAESAQRYARQGVRSGGHGEDPPLCQRGELRTARPATSKTRRRTSNGCLPKEATGRPRTM
jgi:hypothetical protein